MEILRKIYDILDKSDIQIFGKIRKMGPIRTDWISALSDPVRSKVIESFGPFIGPF